MMHTFIFAIHFRFSYKKHLAMTMILFVFTCFSMIPCNAIIATLVLIIQNTLELILIIPPLPQIADYIVLLFISV